MGLTESSERIETMHHPYPKYLIGLAEKHGVKAAMCWLLEYCVRRAWRLKLRYHDVHFYRQRIPEEFPEIHPAIPIDVQDLNTDHVEAMRVWLRKGKADLFLQRSSEGKDGLVCLHEGQVIYHTWYTNRDEYDSSTEMWVRLKPGEGYIYDSFCKPAFRGKGIHSCMQTIRLRRLRDLDCEFAIGVVHTTNFSSRFSLVRTGYKPYERKVSIGIGRRLYKFSLKPSLLRWEIATE